MQGDQLRGLPVVSVQQAERLGTVDDVLIEVPAHQIGGVLLQGGMFHSGPMVRWADVRSVGRDALMVDQSSAALPVSNHDQLLRLDKLRGTKVVGDNGELAGTLAEADFEPETGKIISYMVTAPEGGGLFHAAPRFRVPPNAIAGLGPDLITIDAKAIDFQQKRMQEDVRS